MFNSALSTTPPTLLDWPHVWILACIIFVFITLFFYVVILVKDKIRARSLILKIFPLGKGNQTNHQKLTRGVKRGLLDPQRALFSPLEVLYGTKFGSKHHIMATMANVYKVCITDPFLDPWAPQRAVSWAKQAAFSPQIVLNMAFWPLKWSSDGPNCLNFAQNIPFWYSGPIWATWWPFQGQKSHVQDYLGP